MSTSIPNPQRLKAIAHESETAQVIMMELSDRKRLRNFSDIKRQKLELRRLGFDIVEADFNRFWQTMQAEKYGSIVVDAKGRPATFKWSYSLKDVAQAAMSGEVKPPPGVKVPSFVPNTANKDLKVSKLSKEEQREIKRQEQEIFKAKALAVIEASKNDPFNGVQLKVPVSESPKSTVKVRKAAKQEQEAEKAPQENHNSSKVERVVMIPLREDYLIRIALPSDVTKSEVDFLANMLRRSMI